MSSTTNWQWLWWRKEGQVTRESQRRGQRQVLRRPDVDVEEV
jgi:hypothetical protein